MEIVKSNQVFNKSSEPAMLGTYIRDNIRHAIAHIIRNDNDAINLRIDSFEQNSHLNYVVKLMRFIARDKLNKLFNQLDSKFLDNSVFNIFK